MEPRPAIRSVATPGSGTIEMLSTWTSQKASVKKNPGALPVMSNSSTPASTDANVAPGGNLGSNVIGSSSPKPTQPGGRAVEVVSAMKTESVVQFGVKFTPSVPSSNQTPDGPSGPMMSRSISLTPTGREMGSPKKSSSMFVLTSTLIVTEPK